MPRLNARSLKATVVLNTDEITALGDPPTPRVVLTIAVPNYGPVSADIAGKSLRKAQNTIAEHGADGVACVLQGKLTSGGKIAEAGLVAQVKAPKLAEAAAWAANEMIKGPARVKGKLAPSVEELKDIEDIDYQYDVDVKGG